LIPASPKRQSEAPSGSSRIPDNVLFPYGKQRIEESSGFLRWVLSWMPDHFYLALRHEAHLVKTRVRHTLRGHRVPAGLDLLVNLGCGGTGQEGWVNVDMYGGPNVNLVYDVRKRLPLRSGSAKGIFCEHFLEHLEYSEEVPFFIAECYRLLKPGGVLRLIVPDGEAYLRAYCSGGWEALARIRPLHEGRKDYWYGNRFETRMELINLVFRQATEHQFAYDWETLGAALAKHGFSAIVRASYGQGYLPELIIDKRARASESLYVEAVK